MAAHTSPLDNVKVASPCPAAWDDMTGNSRVRFCGQCELNVYNLSGMNRREAEDLIRRADGRLCVRFYRRADGTILTRDCPVGLQAIKRRLSRVRRALASTVLSFLAGLGVYTAFSETEPPTVMGVMTTNYSPVTMGEMSVEETPLTMGQVITEKPRQRTRK